MWWLLSQYLGLRGCQEHYKMNVEDFTLNKDDNSNEFITFTEGPTKTRQGGLRLQPRSVLPKVFATGDSRCPFALFKSYLAKRPEDLKLSGPFYLACIDNPPKQMSGTRKAEWVKMLSVESWQLWKKTHPYRRCVQTKDCLTTRSGKLWWGS